ncbi:MAG: hypothetical protein R3313_02965 [Candidatus Saccharimonadales bacterium]|nr:hypothetical protein [Candidatus Saccharimonadales bacterium]
MAGDPPSGEAATEGWGGEFAQQKLDSLRAANEALLLEDDALKTSNAELEAAQASNDAVKERHRRAWNERIDAANSLVLTAVTAPELRDDDPLSSLFLVSEFADNTWQFGGIFWGDARTPEELSTDKLGGVLHILKERLRGGSPHALYLSKSNGNGSGETERHILTSGQPDDGRIFILKGPSDLPNYRGPWTTHHEGVVTRNKDDLGDTARHRVVTAPEIEILLTDYSRYDQDLGSGKRPSQPLIELRKHHRRENDGSFLFTPESRLQTPSFIDQGMSLVRFFHDSVDGHSLPTTVRDRTSTEERADLPATWHFIEGIGEFRDTALQAALEGDYGFAADLLTTLSHYGHDVDFDPESIFLGDDREPTEQFRLVFNEAKGQIAKNLAQRIASLTFELRFKPKTPVQEHYKLWDMQRVLGELVPDEEAAGNMIEEATKTLFENTRASFPDDPTS